jgi:hypothetical protein
MSLQKESEWEKDSWCVSIVAEAMTFAKTQPIGKDASHITKKLRKKISKAIAEAVEAERTRIEEKIRSCDTWYHPDFLDVSLHSEEDILLIIYPSKE